MFYSTDDAFEGGGCLKINGRVTTGAKGVRAFVRYKILLCHAFINVFDF